MEAIEESKYQIPPFEAEKSSDEVIVNTKTVEIVENVPPPNGMDVVEPNESLPQFDPNVTAPDTIKVDMETPTTLTEETELPEKTEVVEEHIIETVIECEVEKDECIMPLEEALGETNGEVVIPVQEGADVTQFAVKTDEYVVTIEGGSIEEDNIEHQEILCQLEGDDNMELEAALRSSNDGCENNNGIEKQPQVLNKEELLDILEGKDTNSSDVQQPTSVVEFNEKAKELQSSLALQQYLELKGRGKTRRSKHKFSPQNKEALPKKKPKKSPVKEQQANKSYIINELVQDWNDDIVAEVECESTPAEQSSDVTDNADSSMNDTKEEPSQSTTLNESNQEEENKSTDGSQRRAGRVIKKKIIFDPDNPDTFTKGKKTKDTTDKVDKTPSLPKKIKTEPDVKAKSPVHKPQWKKPLARNKNQNKQRLSEVDKLLMDEGAVNMIYQLTPEASKGKKNTRTKAELIKKINQNSTPEPNEKKFRERRRELSKSEEVEGKKLSSKQRASLSGSNQTPSVCEEFEAPIDDSIIYRRHSSSSYSSTCMSPRRMSDFDGAQGNKASAQNNNQTPGPKAEVAEKSSDVFMSGGSMDIAAKESIVKKSFLNLKKKLNSTINANMKRKQESKGGEKSVKVKRSSKSEGEEFTKFEKISVEIKYKLAEIYIADTGAHDNFYNIQTLKELNQALTIINNLEDVSVTIITSNCGRLCAGFDLSELRVDCLNTRKEVALELANQARFVLEALEAHNKVLLGGIDGCCQGFAAAMLALCDIGVATEHSTFSWLTNNKPIVPGMSVLTSNVHAFPKYVIREMVYLGRRLSSAEALSNGLISRVISWPQNLPQYLAEMASYLAEDSTQTLLLNKRLLRMDRSIESTATFLRSLEAERDLVVEHWCSPEGQVLITKVSQE